jgi:hypothetical protein
MKATSNVRNRAKSLRYALIVCLLAFHPSVTAAEEMVKITTGNWHIHKPSKEFKDLPALLAEDDNTFNAGIGKLDFVCSKSKYYVLLVQPTVKLRDTESGTISVRAAEAPAGNPPIPLTFRNLYKTKAPLSPSLDWDADIHYAEAGAALLASIKAADVLELTLAGRSYAISVSDLGSRMGSFQLFCEKGVIDDPAHFEEQ